jgi:hypothetical protein
VRITPSVHNPAGAVPVAGPTRAERIRIPPRGGCSNVRGRCHRLYGRRRWWIARVPITRAGSLTRLIAGRPKEALTSLNGGLPESGSDAPLPVGLSALSGFREPGADASLPVRLAALSGFGDPRTGRAVARTGRRADADGEGDRCDKRPDRGDHRPHDDRDRL